MVALRFVMRRQIANVLHPYNLTELVTQPHIGNGRRAAEFLRCVDVFIVWQFDGSDGPHVIAVFTMAHVRIKQFAIGSGHDCGVVVGPRE
jgi:hypothetical protein